MQCNDTRCGPPPRPTPHHRQQRAVLYGGPEQKTAPNTASVVFRLISFHERRRWGLSLFLTTRSDPAALTEQCQSQTERELRHRYRLGASSLSQTPINRQSIFYYSVCLLQYSGVKTSNFSKNSPPFSFYHDMIAAEEMLDSHTGRPRAAPGEMVVH